MQIKSTRERLLATTIICGAAMAMAAPAFAQDAPVQEVVVTGSRIPQPNLNSISPITAVSAAEVKLEGVTRVEDLLNNLPQVFADQGSNISNGSTGTATVDLRGLGSSRTLVLIDGKRVVPGDPGDPAVDLNNIPALILDRVEVDTGGASAVYGSDAVAGVVNFITKKNFSGVLLDAQYSFYQHDNDDTGIQNIIKSAGDITPTGGVTDGYTTEVTAMVGVNAPDGKGNMTAYAAYHSQQAILESSRDFSACTLAETGTTFACEGSGTTFPARFTLLSNTAGTAKAAGLQVSGTGAATTLIPYSAATGSYNFGPLNYFQRPDTRYNLGAYGHYEISPMADVYTSLMFMDDDSTSQLAGSGSFGTNVTVPCSYQLSAAELATFCNGSTAGSFNGNLSRRDVEGGGRDSELRHESYRLQIGMKGDLDKAWSYDASIQYSNTTELTRNTNGFSVSKVQNALSGCTINPADGCIPYDVFEGGQVTKAQVAYLDLNTITGGSTTEQVANLTVTGKLGEYGIKSPWAEDGIGVALGTEYRRENVMQYADAASSSGDVEGSGGTAEPINGSFDVYEMFAEMRIPLAQNKPFIESANLDLAYRFSDYSTAGVTDTYAVQGDYSPIKDIRFRGSFQRAVRAPNILELFNITSVTLAGYTDPCAGTAPTLTLAQCEKTGITAAQYGSFLNVGSSPNQNNELTGGNANLKPEIADTYSVGAVIQPQFIPGLSVSVDYFNIFVANVIESGVASPQTIIDQCATTGAAFYCGLIHRDPQFGSLGVNNNGYILATNVNAGSIQTSGIDVVADYRMPLSRIGLNGLGSVSANLTGTYLLSLKSEPIPGGDSQDCAGYYGLNGCGTPNPTWRSKVRLTWNTPWYGLQVSGQWRYYGSVKADGFNPSPLLFSGSAGLIPSEYNLSAQNYFDLTASIKIKDNYTLRAGVQNIFDQSAPVVGADECPVGPCNGNVYAQVYDSLGRYIFVGLTASY